MKNDNRYGELERYVELSDEWKQCHCVNKNCLDERPRPIYLEILYTPSLDLQRIENICESPKIKIKYVQVSGYVWKIGDNIYVEYLNLDGYLEKRIYGSYDYPKIYDRHI